MNTLYKWIVGVGEICTRRPAWAVVCACLSLAGAVWLEHECESRQRANAQQDLVGSTAIKDYSLHDGKPRVRVGERAPDFILGEVRGEKRYQLSQLWSQRPVVLIFGMET